MADLKWIQHRLVEVGATNSHLAAQLGITLSKLSRIMRGHQVPPEGFEEKAREALDVLEKAQAAWNDVVKKARRGK